MNKRGDLFFNQPFHKPAVLAMGVIAGGFPILARAADATWTSPTSGDWFDAARWTPAVAPNDGSPNPTDTYAATIAAAGSPYTVTVSAPVVVSTAQINSTDAILAILSGGSFTATSGLTLNSGLLRLSGGQLLNTTVAGSGASHAVSGATSTLDNVTLTGSFTVDSGASMRLRRNIRLSTGQLIIEENAGATTEILIDGDVNLLRPGSVVFDGTSQAAIILDPAHTTGSLSIGPETTIRTGSGSGLVGQGAGFTLNNFGFLSAQTPGQHLRINAGVFNNAGVVEASNGSTLHISSASFINTGTLRLRAGGTVLIQGSASPAAADPFAGTLDRIGGTLAITGPFFNAGPALSLDAIGPLELRAATLGREITSAGPAELIAANGLNTLSASVHAPVRINSGAALHFSSQTFKALTINGGDAMLADAPTRQLLQVTSLSIDPAGTLDLNDNDLILRDPSGAAALPAVIDAIQRARGTGDWLGTGLTSTAAKNDPNHLMTLAAISNDRGNGTPFLSTFAGTSVDEDAILVMYTLLGDANLDGRISIADYLRIDRGSARGLTGWINGDFDYSGAIDGADFFLIDQAFAAQSAPTTSLLPAASALPAASPGAFPSALPEPATMATTVGLLALAALRRRRR